MIKYNELRDYTRRDGVLLITLTATAHIISAIYEAIYDINESQLAPPYGSVYITLISL